MKIDTRHSNGVHCETAHVARGAKRVRGRDRRGVLPGRRAALPRALSALGCRRRKVPDAVRRSRTFVCVRSTL